MKENINNNYHPAVRLFFFCAVLVFTMILDHPLYALASLLCAMIRFVYLKENTLPVLLGTVICFFGAFANAILNPMGTHIVFELFGRPFTLEALACGFTGGASFAAVIIWFMCISHEISTERLAAVISGLTPSLSLLLIMVFRLVPGYFRSIRRITEARSCIGKSIGKEAPFFARMSEGFTVLAIMTGWAFESAVTESDSMRARGYGCTERSRFEVYRFTPKDVSAIAILLAAATLTAVCVSLGAAETVFYPSLSAAMPNTAINFTGIFSYSFMMLLPTIENALEELQWKLSLSRL